MRHAPIWIALVFAVPLGSEPLAAQAARPAERSDPQQAGLPPPYYAYPLGPSTREHRTLSVEEAIDAALAQASAYRQSLLDARGAEEDFTQARLAFLPQITAPLSYVGTTPSPRRAPGEDQPAYAAANGINNTIALVSATGQLDVGGRLRAARHRSRDLLAAAHAGSESARRALVLATIDAYFGLSLERQKRRLADETLALSESFAELTRELATAGKAEDTELLRAQAEALRRRDELEQARVAESAASDALRALTGLDTSVHLGVDRPSGELPPVGELETYTEERLVARPELAQLEAQALAAGDDADAARAERHPQLTYTLSGGFDTQDLGDLRRYSGVQAQLALTIPITNFGASHSREVQARLREESLALQKEATLRQLRQELYTARATAFAARERIAEAQRRAGASEKALTLLLARYKEQKATITEVIDAQGAYSDSRTAYYQAITDYHTARARLAPDPAKLSFAPGPHETPPPPEECRLGIEGAPEIAGLRLGMTVEALRARVPSLALPAPDAAGVATAEIEGAALGPAPSDDPAFAVAHASVRLQGGRVVYLRILFSAETTWETKDAFLAAAAARFSLPGPWRAFYDWQRKTLDDPEDLRDLASECAGFRIRLGLGFFSEGVKRVLAPHIKMEDEGQRVAAKP